MNAASIHVPFDVPVSFHCWLDPLEGPTADRRLIIALGALVDPSKVYLAGTYWQLQELTMRIADALSDAIGEAPLPSRFDDLLDGHQ